MKIWCGGVIEKRSKPSNLNVVGISHKGLKTAPTQISVKVFGKNLLTIKSVDLNLKMAVYPC